MSAPVQCPRVSSSEGSALCSADEWMGSPHSCEMGSVCDDDSLDDEATTFEDCIRFACRPIGHGLETRGQGLEAKVVIGRDN